MERLPWPRATTSALALALTVAGATGVASAQGGPGGGGGPGGAALNAPRSGPGPRVAPSFGGTISGRMNLIGPPGAAAYAPPAFSVPSPPPAPVFAPERLDRVDPTIFNQLKLPNLAPGAVQKPTVPIQIPNAHPATPGARQAALPPATLPNPMIKQGLTLSASFMDRGPRIRGGVKWRLFTDQADQNGEHMLVAESTEPSPRFEVDPGSYIVHAVYGLVSAAKFVTVKAGQPAAQNMVIAAGAARLTAFVGGAKAADDAVRFTLTRDDGGVARVVADNVRPGTLLRLPAGAYHVSSVYGDANANVEADLKIEPGKLVEAQVHHKAARVALKLVERPGGQEIADTSWTIMTPGGDVIRESIGALDAVVLAEGDYTAIARHDGRLFQQSFAVRSGVDARVEIATN